MKFEWPNIKLKIYNSEVKFANGTTYLGFFLNNTLSWGTHVKNKIVNAEKKLFTSRSPIKPNWGPPQEGLEWLYTGVVRPTITYGSMIWGRTTEVCFKIEMEKLQNLALCLQGHFRRKIVEKSY